MAPYVLTTPALDELEHLPGLLSDLEAQEPMPLLWVVVDDGSVYHADYAIVTFSAGVVNRAVTQGQLFNPQLPGWKQQAYAKVHPRTARARDIFTKTTALTSCHAP